MRDGSTVSPLAQIFLVPLPKIPASGMLSGHQVQNKAHLSFGTMLASH